MALSKCVLLNARSLKNKLDDFDAEIVHGENFPTVIGITETWLDSTCPNSLFSCNILYEIFRRDRSDGYGGVALLALKHTNPVKIELENCDNLEYVAVRCCINNEFMIFACFYRNDIHNVEILPQLQRAVSDLVHRNEPLVIMGDFNLPGVNWYNSVPTAVNAHSQNEFLNVFLSNGLIQTVFEPTRDENILDLVFTNETDLIRNVSVGAPLSSSDHQTVSFFLNSVVAKRQTRSKMRLWAKSDIGAICSHLEMHDWRNTFRLCKNVDEMWISFRLLCNDLFDAFVPCRKVVADDKGFSYPDKIKKMVREKAKLYKKRDHSEVFLQKYKKVAKKCKKEIRNFHLERENKVINSGSLRSVYKFVKSRLKSRPTVAMLEKNDEYISDRNDMADVLNQQYCSVFCDDDGSVPAMQVRTLAKLEDCIITRSSILECIKQLKSGSACGVDGLPVWFFKTFSEQLAVPLQMIFAESFNSGLLPQEWKISLITPVYKGPKHDSKNPASYRPVSLTCIACRIMEKLLKQYIVHHCESLSLFSSNQHGFRGKMSTESQLLECFNDWTLLLDSKEPVDVFYLDVSKAFDTVSHPKLLHKLSKYGIGGKFLNWIKSFLSNRKQAVRVDGALSQYGDVVSGVPQGSVLGPVLFLLFINDLPDVCKNATLKMFADDSKIYFKCGRVENRHKLFSDVFRVFDWFKRNQLKVAIDKCGVLHLGSSNPRFPYRIDGTDLPVVDSIKDIGVWMSSDMKFHDHCNAVAAKASRMSNIFFRAFKSRNKYFVTNFFTTYVRSLLESSCSVWNPSFSGDIRIIESVQRKFTKRIPGLYEMSYFDRLQILGLDTLELRRLQNDLSMCYKIIHGMVNVNFGDFFQFAQTNLHRNRHTQRLRIPKSRLDCRKHSFPCRVVAPWNSLPQKIIDSSTLYAFKSGIKHVDLSPFLKYMC